MKIFNEVIFPNQYFPIIKNKIVNDDIFECPFCNISNNNKNIIIDHVVEKHKDKIKEFIENNFK